MVESLMAAEYDTSNTTPLSMAYTHTQTHTLINSHVTVAVIIWVTMLGHPVDRRSLEEERKFLRHRHTDDVDVINHAGCLHTHTHTHRVTLHAYERIWN